MAHHRHMASVDDAPHAAQVAPRTNAEAEFLAALLLDEPPYLDVWTHTNAAGEPWLCVSLSLASGVAVERTLRLDFDGRCIRGGWSPANLNWDSGLPAQEAGIDTRPPDGIEVTGGSPTALAQASRDWFRARYGPK